MCIKYILTIGVEAGIEEGRESRGNGNRGGTGIEGEGEGSPNRAEQEEGYDLLEG